MSVNRGQWVGEFYRADEWTNLSYRLQVTVVMLFFELRFFCCCSVIVEIMSTKITESD